MILHVLDTDGNSYYVTEMNAIDAATGQARVIFVDVSSQKTFVHLYADFFKVVKVIQEDGEEVEVPQYQVQGVVDALPAAGSPEASEKGARKKKPEKLELKPKPVRGGQGREESSSERPDRAGAESSQTTLGSTGVGISKVYSAQENSSDDVNGGLDELSTGSH